MYIDTTADSQRISPTIIPRINKFGNMYILAIPRMRLFAIASINSIQILDILPNDFFIGVNPQFVARSIFYTVGNGTTQFVSQFHLVGKNATITFSNSVIENYTIQPFSIVWVDHEDSDNSQYEWYGLESENVPNIVATDGSGNVATMVDAIFEYKDQQYLDVIGYISSPESVIWWNQTHIFPANELHDGFFPNGKGVYVKNKSLFKLPNGQIRWAPYGSDCGSDGTLWFLIHQNTLLIGQVSNFNSHVIKRSLYSINSNQYTVADIESNMIAIGSFNSNNAGVSVYSIANGGAELYQNSFIPVPSFNNIKFVSPTVLCIDGLFFELANGIFSLIYDARLWSFPDLNAETYAVTRNRLWNLETLNQSIGTALVPSGPLVTTVSTFEMFDSPMDYPYYDTNRNFYTDFRTVGYQQIAGLSMFWWHKDGKIYHINETATAFIEDTEFSPTQISQTIDNVFGYGLFYGRFASVDGTTWYLNFNRDVSYTIKTTTAQFSQNYPYWGRLIEMTDGFYDSFTGVKTNIVNSNEITVVAVTPNYVEVQINSTTSRIYGNHKFAICTGEIIYTHEGIYTLSPNTESKRWRQLIENIHVDNMNNRKSAVATANGFIYFLWTNARYYNIEEGVIKRISPVNYESSLNLSTDPTRHRYTPSLNSTGVTFPVNNGIKVREHRYYDVNYDHSVLSLSDLSTLNTTYHNATGPYLWMSATQQVNTDNWKIYHVVNVETDEKVELPTQTFDFESYRNEHNLSEMFTGWRFNARVWWNTVTQHVFIDSVLVPSLSLFGLTDSRDMSYVKLSSTQFLRNSYEFMNQRIVESTADYIFSETHQVFDNTLNSLALPFSEDVPSIIALDDNLAFFQWKDTLMFKQHISINGETKVTYQPFRINSNIKGMAISANNPTYIHCLSHDNLVYQIEPQLLSTTTIYTENP
jgi:hypothetical protein